MRIARLHFADGHTEETVIPDVRADQIRRGDRYFYKTDSGKDGLPSYREGKGDGELRPEDTQSQDGLRSDGGAETFGPKGDDSEGW